MPSRLFALILEGQTGDFNLVVRELQRANLADDCRRVETEAQFREQLPARPDVILADFDGPRLGALRALEVLRESGQDVPLIVLAAGVAEDRVFECIRRGAADYLLKDRLARLPSAVRRALEENDLRRQKKAVEAALRKSNERFQHLVETTKVIPCEMDLETWRFTYVGPQAGKLMGYPLEDWYMEGFWNAHIHMDDPHAQQALRHSLNSSVTDHAFNCRVETRSGGVASFHCVVRSMRDDTGAHIARGFMMEIPEMKRMVETLGQRPRATVLCP